MNLVSVCGVMGSGKTTLIRKLIDILNSMGKRAGLIVNEAGVEDYSKDFLDAYGIHAVRIRGG